MEIYILRHGIAEDGQAGQPDSERALTPDGRKKLRTVLRVAANAGVAPSLILTSPYKRALQTAQIAAEILDYKGELLRTKSLEPISARLVADLLKTAGADRIVTVDLHTDQIQGFFDGPVDHMRGQALLTAYIKDNYPDGNMVVVSPDSGRVRIAEKWADALGGVPLAFIHKTRDPRVPNQVVSNRVVGDVQGRTCVLIDDMIDTGGTIAGAVKLLHNDGAKDVVIAATHGVLSDPASERLAACGAREVIVTNTLPIDEEKRFNQLTVLSIAPLLATTIRAVFENGSVTGLFDGDA